MADELSRLVAEVQAVGDGLAARVVTLEEHPGPRGAARGPGPGPGRDAARSSAMGRPGSSAAGSGAAEGGTTQPASSAACLDRA
jgi:hypothetical protein